MCWFGLLYWIEEKGGIQYILIARYILYVFGEMPTHGLYMRIICDYVYRYVCLPFTSGTMESQSSFLCLIYGYFRLKHEMLYNIYLFIFPSVAEELGCNGLRCSMEFKM